MNRIKCWNCGLVNFESETACRRYAQDLRNAPLPPPQHPPQYLNQPGAYYPQPATSPAPSNDAAPYGAPVATPAPPYPVSYPAPYTADPQQNPNQNPDQGSYQDPYQGPFQGPYQGQYQSPYQGSYQGAYQQAYPSAYQGAYLAGPDTRSQGQALAALIIGCISWTLCGIAAPVGLVLGIVAVRKTSKKPAEYRGKGMAIAGICLNGAYTLIVPVVIAAILLPNLWEARIAVNEAAAISRVRTVSDAEDTYMRNLSISGHYATLDELIAAGLLEKDAGQNNGYRFTVVLTEPPVQRSRLYEVHSFEIHAVPISYGSSGNRSFCQSVDGVIHAADKHGAQADSTAPVYQPPK